MIFWRCGCLTVPCQSEQLTVLSLHVGRPDDALAPFSLVCKAVSANGQATVKLSDNPEKARGPVEEIERYKRVFGVGEQEVWGGVV